MNKPEYSQLGVVHKVRTLVPEEQVPNLALIAYDSGRLILGQKETAEFLDFDSPILLSSVTMEIEPLSPPKQGYVVILITAEIDSRQSVRLVQLPLTPNP